MTNSRLTHPRKGREGNKEGKGREARERSHHIVTLVDVRGRDVVVSATRLDDHPDLTTIEHLDFTPDLPCEHPVHPSGIAGHEGPGWALIEIIHSCGEGQRRIICKGGWLVAGIRGTRCQACHEHLSREQSWRIIGRLA